MKRLFPLAGLASIALVLCALDAPAQDNQAADAQEGNVALAKALEAAWNTHDMEGAFRKLLTDDVDWVNVDGYRGAGIEPVVEGHVRVHADKFKDSVVTIKDVSVALLKPDVAIVHVSWGMRGDRNNDGTPREPREGLFTWVTVKVGDSWKIRASHNSNMNVIR
jgi:uncharacterized protein (TIGR02246 family)